MTALMTRTSTPKFAEASLAQGDIDRILAAAQRAPDHGRLRPWRFVVIEGEARQAFGQLLAISLRRREPEASEAKLEAERNKALRAPLIIAVAAEVQEHPRIPQIEQILAVGAAVENMLLAAHALGFGANWKTGPAAYDPTFKEALGLASTAQLVGFVYLGKIATPGRLQDLEAANVTLWLPPNSTAC